MKRLLAIANPISGRGRASKLGPRLARLARDSGVEIHLQLTTHAGHSHTASPAEAAAPSEPATPSEVAASERPPPPEAVRAMVADARSCADVGWATTKSASSVQKSRVVHNDQVYWCLPEDLNRSPRCCAAVPGQTSPP